MQFIAFIRFSDFVFLTTHASPKILRTITLEVFLYNVMNYSTSCNPLLSS